MLNYPNVKVLNIALRLSRVFWINSKVTHRISVSEQSTIIMNLKRASMVTLRRQAPAQEYGVVSAHSRAPTGNSRNNMAHNTSLRKL